tara:strand:+ start:200 stop:1141 length:942 start_codon:yes stop_codon:yes gene_type:complete
MANISVVIPIYNEEKSIILLIEKLMQLKEEPTVNRLEVLFINDGSNDKSLEVIRENIPIDDNFKIINLLRNYGQTAAIAAGIDIASNNIIITMDGDLQNDTADIPKLLMKLDEGFDVVSGWRKNRKDPFLTKVLPSKIANSLISWISGVYLHDYGCTLKAYRKKVLEGVKLYGEMHRFIPILTSWQGGKVTEIPVSHHSRKHGKSNYGLSRTFVVIIDLIFIKYLEKHFIHPMILFGGFSILNFALSLVSFILMIYFKYWNGDSFIQTPLPQLIVIFVMTGMLSLFMGFLAEILMRTYFESQNKKSYRVTNNN